MTTARKKYWYAKHLQMSVDALLRRVLAGEDASKVFRLDSRNRGRPKDSRKAQAMCCEVARLTAQHGTSRLSAIGAVEAHFDVDSKTVERACTRWDDASIDVDEYVADLEAAGLL